MNQHQNDHRVMETGGLMVGDEVTIEINAEAVKGA